MSSFRNIVFAISSVSDVSEVLPFSAWVVYGKKQRPYQLLGGFFALLFAARLFTLITAEFKLNNMPVYHLLALIEILSVYCFYAQFFYGHVFRSGIFIITGLHLFSALFLQNIWMFNSVTYTFDMVLIIVLGLLYFVRTYNNEQNLSPLDQRPDFIITVGWLLYAAGALFTYLMSSKILSGYAEGFFKNGWFFQSSSNILKNLIIGYGFWLTKKQ